MVYIFTSSSNFNYYFYITFYISIPFRTLGASFYTLRWEQLLGTDGYTALLYK